MLAGIRSLVRNNLVRRLGVPEIEPALERLCQQGFSPRLIFDVGAYRGDFARMCRRIWPAARVACFEAQSRAVKQLEALAREDPSIAVHPVLLGAREQSSVVLHEAETASSILQEKVQGHAQATYPMTSVDLAVEKYCAGQPPDFLKLDVQGYELEVLKGATRALDQVQVILAEVNLLDIHDGVPLLAEMLSWLDERGFVAFDICGLTRRPLDRALWQADMVFVGREHQLRVDKRWDRESL